MLLICMVLFAGGVALLGLPLLRTALVPRPTYLDRLRRLRPPGPVERTAETVRLALLRRIVTPELERRLELAGAPFGLSAFGYQLLRLVLVGIVILTAAGGLTLDLWLDKPASQPPTFRCFIIGLLVWFGPSLVIRLAAGRRKTKLLHEISRLSHRLSVCLSGEADLRDMLLRAGRTSRELRPYLNELAAAWNKNQQDALHEFGRGVGVTEVFPLVNTLIAVSQVEPSEVAEMLDRQVESIDKTLEHEVARKLENAPLAIIFLIMIPFMVVFALMVFPWMHEMTELLYKSF